MFRACTRKRHRTAKVKGGQPLGAIDSTRQVRTNPLTNSLIPFPGPPAGLCSYLNTEAGDQVRVVQGNVLWSSLWDK